MGKKEIKTEIQKLLEDVPENILEEVLAFLKEINSEPKDALSLSNNLRKILVQDKELLKRLAR